MAGELLQNIRILVAKEETTPGTWIWGNDYPDSADFNVRIRNPEITPNIDPDDENSKFQTGDHGEDESIMGANGATIAFNIKFAWGGAVATDPLWWKFMYGCGALKKTYTTTGVALQPAKVEDETTLSIAVLDIPRGSPANFSVYKFAGCSGNCVFGADGIGMPWSGAFTFQGKFLDVVDVAIANLPVLTSPQTTLAEKHLNNPMTIGGTAACISSWQLDMGNDVQPTICQSDTTGYLHYGIVARRPRFSCNPLAKLVATKDWHGILNAQTPQIIEITSAAASPNLSLRIPEGQLLSNAVANREGLVNWDQNFKCLRNDVPDSAISEVEATWELLQGARA